MPYLRLYSGDVPLQQKRVIARDLIDITLRTFQLRPEERNRITIQFLPLRRFDADSVQAQITGSVDLALEVSDRDLTEEKKKAFAEEVTPVLSHSINSRPRNRIARLLGAKVEASRQIAVQFNQAEGPEEWTSDGHEDRHQERSAA